MPLCAQLCQLLTLSCAYILGVIVYPNYLIKAAHLGTLDPSLCLVHFSSYLVSITVYLSCLDMSYKLLICVFCVVFAVQNNLIAPS